MKANTSTTTTTTPCTTPKLVLEDVIGVTIQRSVGLAADGSSDKCVYLAGCVAVVYDVGENTRLPFQVLSRPPKPLSCVAVSRCGGGAFVAAGESGSQPAVLVWDRTNQMLLAELKGHRFGVSCIDFSPGGEYVVSVGFPHDAYMILWDWRSKCLLVKVKASTSNSPICFVRFSVDKNHFITGGKKHLKFWTVKSATRFRSNVKPWALDGKPSDLCSFKSSAFVAVASVSPVSDAMHIANGANNSSLVFALNDEGILCLFYFGFSIRKWIDLKVNKGFALAASTSIVACACSFGIVRLVDVETFKEIGSLQLNKNENQLNSDDSVTPEKSYAAIPDAVACQFSSADKLLVVYGDHSLYVWHLTSINKAIRTCVLVSHSACIWDVKNLPCVQMHKQPSACVAKRSCNGFSFATCSEDKTIRLWDFLLDFSCKKVNANAEIVNKQTPDHSFGSQGGLSLASSAVFERHVDSIEQIQGFHSLATSSDRGYLAVGDSKGSVHVYNLRSYEYTCFQEAHSADVLSLDFCSPSVRNDHGTDVANGHYLLASGGRDGKIHIYDVDRSLSIIQSFDDHSAAVSSLKFSSSGSKILSCSTDRSILFRDVTMLGDTLQVTNEHHGETISHGLVYDMAVDHVNELAVTVGQDKKMNVFDISTGKFIRAIYHTIDFGEPLKLVIDPSGICIACSYSNKCVVIYDFGSGEIIAQAVGHAEAITGIIFLPDYERMISVSADSCIFIWRLPTQLTSKMLQRISEMVLSSPSMQTETVLGIQKSTSAEEFLSEHASKKEQSRFKFSISKLPKWAQTKVIDSSERSNSKMLDFVTSSKFYTPSSCNVKICDDSTSECASDAGKSVQMEEETPGCKHKSQWNTIHYVYLNELQTPQLFDKSRTVLAAAPKLIQSSESLEGRAAYVPIGGRQILGDQATTRNEGEITRLRDVLLKLDAAAGETLESLTRLMEVACQNDISSQCTIDLKFASKLIPSIKGKVDKLNDLISLRDNLDFVQ